MVFVAAVVVIVFVGGVVDVDDAVDAFAVAVNVDGADQSVQDFPLLFARGFQQAARQG